MPSREHRPGMVVGGFVAPVKENLSEGVFIYDICETDHSLHDPVQLLTPCTVGKGWLKIVVLNRLR